MLGIQSLGLTATATAVSSFPSKVAPGALLPVAITKCLYDNYWDSALKQPKLDPLTGQPYEFKLTSSYHTGPCEAGQWTSLLTDRNDVPTIRGLIANGNPDPIGIGDEIWIEPGTKTALYADVPVGEDVLLPIVADITTHADVAGRRVRPVPHNGLGRRQRQVHPGTLRQELQGAPRDRRRPCIRRHRAAPAGPVESAHPRPALASGVGRGQS